MIEGLTRLAAGSGRIIVLGGYAAKRCPVRTHNNFAPLEPVSDSGAVIDRRYRSKDLTKAFACYQKAAEAGNVRAMGHLGKLLSCRYHAVPLDLPAARAWLAKAAAYGDAMYQLGWFMQYELEPPDEAIASELVQKR